ncbi:MAG TPA: LysM domain-containing protein, partial [Caldilineaceae bacterium]|nr:LysM domain-containing protein [Caldilineaceae bacterium]
MPPAGLDYTIQAGDTLGTIAARYGLTWQQIATANGLGAYSILEIGQVIRLPGVQGTGSAAAGSAPASTVPLSVST